jgi:hypothetical protein
MHGAVVARLLLRPYSLLIGTGWIIYAAAGLLVVVGGVCDCER